MGGAGYTQFFRIALLFGLPLLASSQDGAWLEGVRKFSKQADPSLADSLRRELADSKDEGASSVIRAIRSILLQVSVQKKVDGSFQALSSHLEKLGGRPKSAEDHRKGLAIALSLGSDGLLLALAHIDHLLLAGDPAVKFTEESKKLKLRAVDSTLATDEGALLSQLKKTMNSDELEKLSRSASPELQYCAAIAMLKAIEKDLSNSDKAQRILSALKKWSPEHIEALLNALKTLKPCASCRGTRKVSCSMCNGRGQRDMVCPHCGGLGKVKWDKHLPISEEEKRYAKFKGLADDEVVCPTCRGDAFKANRRTVQCGCCEGKGTVECQRCKWQKISFDAIGKIEPCRNCGGNGTMFVKVLHPCAFCKGLGEFVLPIGASEKTVGPKE